jgi:hypothetical protein
MEKEGENVADGLVEKRSDFSHDNLPRELEMFLPLGFKVYLLMHLSAFGESL